MKNRSLLAYLFVFAFTYMHEIKMQLVCNDNPVAPFTVSHKKIHWSIGDVISGDTETSEAGSFEINLRTEKNSMYDKIKIVTDIRTYELNIAPLLILDEDECLYI